MSRTDVLIVGAGPTGLILALSLVKQGIGVRIIDKIEQTASTSRAIVIHARTLELYKQLGIDADIVADGYQLEAMNLWVNGKRRARIAFGDMGKTLTPHPYLHVYGQDAHERLLIERLESLGVVVERNIELVNFVDHGTVVTARCLGADGQESVCEASYIVGCDGAHSAVRRGMEVEFSGSTYPQLFFVADIEGSGPIMNAEAHIAMEKTDLLLSFCVDGKSHARLIGIMKWDRTEQRERATFEDIPKKPVETLHIEMGKVNWFSTYSVHHRVSSRFRQGRAFLAGDAAHVHSPAGGQGMNTGIGDSLNLAWKLAAVIQERADDELLDSYEPERRAFALRLVKTTDRVFTIASATGALANFFRVRIVPVVMWIAFRIPALPNFFFRTVSQSNINYRGGRLAEGKAGKVRGGDRLPWTLVNGASNFDVLDEIAWQVHVYGSAKEELTTWCKTKGVRLHVFDWTAEHKSAGLVRDAAYLLRPDSYIGAISASGDSDTLGRYLSSRGLQI